MHPERLFIKDFLYELPEERIAKYPLPQRDQSKLLIYKKGEIKEDIYYNLDKYIPASSLLVFNNTKVVEARLLFQKSTGSTIELFCLEPGDEYPDITTAMTQKRKVVWKCLAGGAKKWKEEPLIKMIRMVEHDPKEIILTARKIKKEKYYFLVELNWNDESLSFAELLHFAGAVPLPPYLHREAEMGHEMHAEYIEVRKDFIENLLNHLHNNIIAVGTTSLRTIESLYWLGVKTIIQPEILLHDLQLHQWEAYDLNPGNVSIEQSLQALLQWMKKNETEILITKTQIIIAPGYDLKIANALITNFHQPQSTLLLLVAALVHDNWKKIYDYALANNFRFLSYGDGNLIWKS